MTIRVVLVDDHPVVRAGLRGLLAADPGIDVVGAAAGSDEALVVVGALARGGDGPPDVVLMDLQLGPGPGGIETTRALLAEHPGVRVLVLSTFDTDGDVFGALEAGAVGYLLKDTPTATLLQAVRDAAAGRPALAPEIAMRVLHRVTDPASALTERETEILRLLATGGSNKEIARGLFLSESTVKGHLARLYDKLGVDNRTAAVAAARERGLLR